MSDMTPKDISAIVEELLAKTRQTTTTDMQSVLELLAMTMFADKQVLAVEIQAFVDIILRFQYENVLKTDLSEADIIAWYEDHKANLVQIVQHGAFEPWIENKIETLKDFPDKHLLLRAMNEIASADGEVHVSEKALEVLTAKKWADTLLQKYDRKWVA